MGKQGAFKTIQRKNSSKRLIDERIKDYKEVYIPLIEEEISEQTSRCMDCGIPFCNWGCPLGNLAPDFNEMVYKGEWKKAYKRLSLTSSFPEFTGRLCPALCEAACTLGINREPMSIREIELSIIERAYKEGWVKIKPPKIRTNKKVAVIGSGPSGLAASAKLNSVGHNVTVFEKADEVGGLLRYGIPDFKLEKRIIDRRIEIMVQEGIEFRTKTNVGIDIKTDEILAEFDAVILAGGCTIPKNLNVQGCELNGVHFAIDYLIQQNKRAVGKDIKDYEINAKDKVVVVIGGGDTGSDCVGTAVRQGAKNIYQFEIMPKPPVERDENMPWPTFPRLFKTSTSHEEGCIRDWNVCTKKVSGENDQVKKLHCAKVQWSKEKNGKMIMNEIKGSEFTLDTDLIILAMGFLHPQHEGMINDLGLELDVRGNILTDQNYMTTIPGVFAAGDMRTGQSLIVKAIEEGRSAAKNIDKYLMGETFLAF